MLRIARRPVDIILAPTRAGSFFYITLGLALSHSGVSPDHSRLLLASRPGSPLIVSTSTWTCSQVEFLRRRPFGDAWPISLPYFTALHTLPHTFVSAGGTSALGASYFLKKRAKLVCFKISGTSAVGPPVGHGNCSLWQAFGNQLPCLPWRAQPAEYRHRPNVWPTTRCWGTSWYILSHT